MDKATVYTETMIHVPPQQYAADAPYQIAIVDLPAGGRLTVRVVAGSERVTVGDNVVFVESRDGVAYFQKTGGPD